LFILQTRVSITSGWYYYAKVGDSPFSLAVVLPVGYGHTKFNYSKGLRSKIYDPKIDDYHCDAVRSAVHVSIGVSRGAK